MAVFQVHPHFGYLNSDVRLINGSDSILIVKDSVEGKEYEIPALSNISVRLKAGEHIFTIAGEDSAAETIVVEDAIKLGGSREKKTYIFEGTPWALMVMLDRTYFYNRETKEQYLEHGLAPKNIQFLTSNYLLFVSDKDNSIFSLDNLSVEKTIGGSSFLYSNEHYAIFSSQDGLILYSMDDGVETRLTSLGCNDFAIDDTKQILFYHLEDKREVQIKHLGDPNAKEILYKLSDPFRCFIGKHSVIFGNSPQSLSVIDLHSKEATKLYDDIVPVTTINSKVVWGNTSSTSMEDKDVKNAFTSYAELTIYERPERWFYVVKTNHVLKNRGLVSNKVKYTLHSTNEEGSYLQSDQPMTITEGKSFDCVKNNCDKGFLIFNKKHQEFEGEPIVSPSGYILIATKDKNSSKILVDPLSPSFKHPNTGYDTETLFRKTGLIKVVSISQVGEKKTEIQFHDIENKRVFANSIYEDLDKDGFYRLSGGVGDYIHSQDGYVHAMPCTKDRLIAISEQCNYAIVRSEEGVVLYGYDPVKKEWSGTPFGNMEIDESFYSKAVFCSDGENIIYQKKGKEYFLRQIGSDEESEFELQGSVIRRNINGYIPYLDFDTHRKPVYVDPVSLTRIEDAAAGQFTYQSVDGKITHVAHNVVKYYSYEKKQYVSTEEYKRYVAEYDYEMESPLYIPKKTGPRYEEARKNRSLYYNANKSWLDEKLKPKSRFFFGVSDSFALNAFLEDGSACDSYIFRKEYYIRESANGEVIDIQLPQALYFLNYVSYSYDNRYIIVAGRFPMSSFQKGLAMVYDVRERKIVYMSTSTMAVWLGVFSKRGMVAYYDSTPSSFVSDNVANKESYNEIKGRSFLTFSPSGKYIALSRQGYIPYISGHPHWGHQPSRDVYVVRSEDPNNELAHYCDHGDQIEGTGGWDRTNSSVASATFSKDDKKLMTVSKDGVVVVRNLHFEDVKESSEEEYPF